MDRYRFILCRPRDGRNIEASIDLLETLGFDPPLIASPVEGATEGFDLSPGIVCDSLREALNGVSTVLGITRRVGQRRKVKPYGLHEWNDLPFGDIRPEVDYRSSRIAFVFGNETSGLSDDELMQCHAALAIPSNPACPSLNLSHAVALVAYEVARHESPAPLMGDVFAGTGNQIVTAAQCERRIPLLLDRLRRLGFHSQDGPQGMGTFLRDLFGRAAVTATEQRRIEALFEGLREAGS